MGSFCCRQWVVADLLLELVRKRFWCQHLCPLGALLAINAPKAWLRRRTNTNCNSCTGCHAACPAGALSVDRWQPDQCLQCGACQARCPKDGINFQPIPTEKTHQDLPVGGYSRRAFLTGAACGVAAPIIVPNTKKNNDLPATFMRPPGVTDNLGETAFLDRCVRCGACMQACPNDLLTPDCGTAGLNGVFAPKFTLQANHCPTNCTACADVCPTGAIPAMATRANARPGTAKINQAACISYTENASCGVCYHKCPLEEKAIHRTIKTLANGVTVKLPSVVTDRCIGCGICVEACKDQRTGAMQQFRPDEERSGFKPHGTSAS